MNTYSIELRPIHRNLLHAYWTKARGFIASALEESRGEMDLDDVLAAVIEGRFYLFGFFSGAEVVGAATVEVVEYPKKRTAMIVHMGAQRMEDALSALSSWDPWLEEHKINSVMLWGRRGWERVLAPGGFDFCYSVLERKL